MLSSVSAQSRVRNTMLPRLTVLFVAAGFAYPFVANAQAPAVQAVQQPVVRRFSVGTSAAVPDGGRAFLGGVGRSASGRNTYGPLRSGTNSGFETSNTSQSVSVQIIDLESMDRELLNSGSHDAAAKSPRRRIHPRAETAWQTMQARQRKTR
ncbi:MAG: hypothetical protein JWM11_4617 [Planctomycetaceae bacterium]|nr:hypothetical protein [Planctomycetaceae bacterium]